MNNTLISRLEGLSARFEEVSTLITDPPIISDMKRYVKLNKEYSELERIITKRNEYQRLLQNLAEAKEILGTIRNRFGNLPGPNGTVVQDGAELKQEAKTMKEELTKDLMNFVPGGDIPLMPFLG